MKSVLLKLGSNWVVDVQHDSTAEEPRLTFYKLEFEDTPSAEEARALAAALIGKKETQP